MYIYRVPPHIYICVYIYIYTYIDVGLCMDMYGYICHPSIHLWAGRPNWLVLSADEDPPDCFGQIRRWRTSSPGFLCFGNQPFLLVKSACFCSQFLIFVRWIPIFAIFMVQSQILLMKFPVFLVKSWIWLVKSTICHLLTSTWKPNGPGFSSTSTDQRGQFGGAANDCMMVWSIHVFVYICIML